MAKFGEFLALFCIFPDFFRHFSEFCGTIILEDALDCRNKSEPNQKNMSLEVDVKFNSVYGPVKSWRYGRSLGIDPIGPVSTCSFNCVYCQLGEIVDKTSERRIFIPTAQILEDLQPFAPWDVDIVTLSGSGEPTLAANLGEIITEIKALTHCPVLVLTNATLLNDDQVCQELALADKVSVKIDGVSPDRMRGVDRPVAGIELPDILAGIKKFSLMYGGELGIQTMLLNPWNKEDREEYIRLVQAIAPTEIQLNTPTRPKPLKHELAGRENHEPGQQFSYPVRFLKSVSSDILQQFANEITAATGILVRYAPAN